MLSRQTTHKIEKCADGNSSGNTVVGSYVGTGGTQSINLGFQPQAVLISSSGSTNTNNKMIFKTRNQAGFENGLINADNNNYFTVVQITASGFDVRPGADHYYATESGATFYYIAFR